MSYCEIPDFYSESCHIARKPHRCCECRKPIEAGEKYVACAFKFDGRMFYEKQHVRCYHFARWVNWGEPNARNHLDSCVEFGEIRTHLFECGDLFIDEDDVQKASTPIGEMWLRVVAGEDCAPRTLPDYISDATNKAALV